MLPAWRIFYDDGSTFDSNQGAASSAPREGFLCSIGYDETGKRYIMHSWDFYRWDAGTTQFWGHDVHGIIDWFKRAGDITEIDAGDPTHFTTTDGSTYDVIGLTERMKTDGKLFEARTVTRTIWQETMIRANNDPDFPIGGR